MKAPAFLFYAGDFLSSPDVQAMDTREVGAYLLLLLNAWQGDLPGHLPNNEDRLRRLTRLTVAEWEVSRELLLSKFPVADMGHTRYNPRMVTEAEKQAENRRKQAENGKRGGRPKKPTESQNNPPLSVENPTLSETKANANPNESFSISISEPTNVGKQAREPEPSKPKPVERRLPLPAEDVELFKAAEWPSLKDPARFAQVCAQLGFPQVDFARYRPQIIASLEGKELPATSLRNWIKSYLNNDQNEGALLVPAAQAPNERPSNYTGTAPYVPPVGGRIPDMSTVMNPNWKPPQA
jgi:uncharacterized protein YdaU (DUF1376 family)